MCQIQTRWKYAGHQNIFLSVAFVAELKLHSYVTSYVQTSATIQPKHDIIYEQNKALTKKGLK